MTPVIVGCCGFPLARARYFGRFSALELQQTFCRYSDDDLGRLETMCHEELAAGRWRVYAMFNNASMLEDAQRFQSLLADH